MDIIQHSAKRHILAVARGHPYDRNAFCSLFEGLEDTDVTLVEQPLAQQCYRPDIISGFDAVVCYDMPGVDFSSVPGEARALEPTAEFKANFMAMLQDGKGVLFLHHALAAWPAWDEYAGIVGGRFHYRPSQLRGVAYPDSGYRHKVKHRLRVMAEHPVTRGVDPEFEMTDELYLCPVFEDEVEPLLCSDFDFSQEQFYSAAQAVAGDMNSRREWHHPPGSSVVGWAHSVGPSPVVYLQGGDDAQALQTPAYRALVQNALRWLAGTEARQWAENRSKSMHQKKETTHG